MTFLVFVVDVEDRQGAEDLLEGDERGSVGEGIVLDKLFACHPLNLRQGSGALGVAGQLP